MNFKNTKHAQSEIQKAEQLIAAAEQFISEQCKLSPEQLLAIQLHDAQCPWNHTDACGWYYGIEQGGIHDWTEYSHAMYLEKAHKLISILGDVDAARRAVEALTSI